MSVWLCVRLHVCVMSCAVTVDLSYLKPKQRDYRSPGRTTDHAHNVSGWQRYIEVWGSAFDPCRPLVWLQVASPANPTQMFGLLITWEDCDEFGVWCVCVFSFLSWWRSCPDTIHLWMRVSPVKLLLIKAKHWIHVARLSYFLFALFIILTHPPVRLLEALHCLLWGFSSVSGF